MELMLWHEQVSFHIHLVSQPVHTHSFFQPFTWHIWRGGGEGALKSPALILRVFQNNQQSSSYLKVYSPGREMLPCSGSGAGQVAPGGSAPTAAWEAGSLVKAGDVGSVRMRALPQLPGAHPGQMAATKIPHQLCSLPEEPHLKTPPGELLQNLLVFDWRTGRANFPGILDLAGWGVLLSWEKELHKLSTLGNLANWLITVE